VENDRPDHFYGFPDDISALVQLAHNDKGHERRAETAAELTRFDFVPIICLGADLSE
jgi:hypothetical protein